MVLDIRLFVAIRHRCFILKTNLSIAHDSIFVFKVCLMSALFPREALFEVFDWGFVIYRVLMLECAFVFLDKEVTTDIPGVAIFRGLH